MRWTTRSRVRALLTFSFWTIVAGTSAADDFVNFESGHTRPLAISPDGTRLFALNTPDNRLSIFDIDASGLELVGEVGVGLEPVALATRINTSGVTEVWVVNHLSDDVSVVEIDAIGPELSRVVRTLYVGDEPRDIVFADAAQPKAFITTARRGQHLPAGVDPRFNEEGVGRALVWVFDAEDASGTFGGAPITILELFGDTPRALAVTPDGSTVYAAIFHSGNGTMTLRSGIVNANGGLPPLPPDSPYADNNPAPPASNGLVIRRDYTTGEWNDELGRDWSSFVFFDLPDYDVFAIDADADPPVLATGIDRFSGVGTVLFNLAVNPATGSVFVSNTDARNDVRFEPIAAGGVQGHLTETRITVIDGMNVTPVHVNPHINYAVATGPPAEIAQSLAFLTDMTFSSDGTTLYAAALGSNQVAAFDAAALESGVSTRDLIDVGSGPSGVALDEANDRLYVLNRLDETISVVSDVSNPGLRQESSVVNIGHDPTPQAVRDGRRFLYDARATSGHGDASCASCHIFGDFDSLAWDLGDPYGAMLLNPNILFIDETLGSDFPDPTFYHPVKGPKTTQSLRGMAEGGTMHWRGDRTAGNDPGGDPMDSRGAFEKFNPAFVGLMGRSAPLATADMESFTDFVLSIRYPPNPNGSVYGELTSEEELGLQTFMTKPVDATHPCNDCHTLPLGTNRKIMLEGDSIEIPHLRNIYQKVGMFGDNGGVTPPVFLGDQVRGFGLANSGEFPSVAEFIQAFPLTPTEREAVTAFVLQFDTGLRPVVGQQATLDADLVSDSGALARVTLLSDRARAGDCDLAVDFVSGGVPQTALQRPDGRFRVDTSASALVSLASIRATAAVAGAEQTYTCHPPGVGNRVGLDRDGDGVMNGDERDEGYDPGDASSTPFQCVGGALEQIEKAQVKIAKNQAPSGDERLSIKGVWTPPVGAPAVDPLQNGLNVLLRDGTGKIVLHRHLAGVPTSSEAGWSVNAAGTKWKFEGDLLDHGHGILKASVGVSRTGQVKVSIKGQNSEFRVTRSDLRLEIVLGRDPEASAGQCATRTFGTGATSPCALSDKLLKCR